jgi:hypothetical protein
MPRLNKQWRELPTFAILFLYELPQVCDTFFAALAQTPSLSKICQIWRPGFYLDGCAIVWTLA